MKEIRKNIKKLKGLYKNYRENIAFKSTYAFKEVEDIVHYKQIVLLDEIHELQLLISSQIYTAHINAKGLDKFNLFFIEISHYMINPNIYYRC